jgi:adenosine deaminase
VSVEKPSTPAVERPIRSLPKAHLHAHLDGSYPRRAVEALARRNGRSFVVPASFADVGEFFEAYGSVPALVRSHEDLASLCRALVHAEAAEGVLYLEPAIEPQLYSPRLGSLGQVTATMLQAFSEAAQDAGIEVGALLTINTDEDLEIADDLALIAADRAGAGVTALGTAGFVEPGRLHRFRRSAAIAHAAGLPIVSHAGQTGGPDSIIEALDELGARRISHGFRAVESRALMDRLAEEQIVCDICPVSNTRLGLIGDIADHPAPRLRAAGIPITLNADDSLWFDASVSDQYEVARRAWGVDDQVLAEFARAGTLVHGMSDGTRGRFLEEIAAWLEGDER